MVEIIKKALVKDIHFILSVIMHFNMRSYTKKQLEGFGMRGAFGQVKGLLGGSGDSKAQKGKYKARLQGTAFNPGWDKQLIHFLERFRRFKKISCMDKIKNK